MRGVKDDKDIYVNKYFFIFNRKLILEFGQKSEYVDKFCYCSFKVIIVIVLRL